MDVTPVEMAESLGQRDGFAAFTSADRLLLDVSRRGRR